MHSVASELDLFQNRTDIHEPINPEGDQECKQEIGGNVILEGPQDEEAEDEVPQGIPTSSAQIRAIAVLRLKLRNVCNVSQCRTTILCSPERILKYSL